MLQRNPVNTSKEDIEAIQRLTDAQEYAIKESKRYPVNTAYYFLCKYDHEKARQEITLKQYKDAPLYDFPSDGYNPLTYEKVKPLIDKIHQIKNSSKGNHNAWVEIEIIRNKIHDICQEVTK